MGFIGQQLTGIRILDEKNDRLKDSIRKRFIEYLNRAEILKEFLDSQDEKKDEDGGTNGTTKKK